MQIEMMAVGRLTLYCNVAVRCWQLMTRGTATHTETGQSFESVTRVRKELAA
ncbi:MAG: hypothetical protein Q4G49_01940 [Paracoccus sp. (in: a-proteobacteria)]|nr:hypothetical protein [Paracoccus sp. (in: a-proteobacteria)]